LANQPAPGLRVATEFDDPVIMEHKQSHKLLVIPRGASRDRYKREKSTKLKTSIAFKQRGDASCCELAVGLNYFDFIRHLL
jgi:hypothetical protein